MRAIGVCGRQAGWSDRMRGTPSPLRLGGALAVAAFPAVVLANIAPAQAEFVVAPTSITISGLPGSTQTAVLTVQSETKRALAAAVVGAPTEGTALAPALVTVTPNRARLVPGLPQVLRVVVVLPSDPGTYVASIGLTLVADPAAPRQEPFQATLPVELSATVSAPIPTPTPAPSQQLTVAGGLKSTEISCSPIVECFVAGLLTSAAAVDRKVALVVQNPGSISASPSQVAFLAIGERSNGSLTSSQVPIASATAIDPGMLGTINFALPEQAAPDHYTGQLAISLEGVPSPVTASIDLTIRQGPLIPGILLGIGLAVGIWIRSARKTLVPAGDAAVRLSSIRRRVADVPLSDRERGVMNERLNEAWKELLEHNTSAAVTHLGSIEDALALFDQFQALQLALGNRTDKAAMDARQKIVNGRSMLEIGEKGDADLAGARQLLQQAAGDAARPEAKQEGRASTEVTTQLDEPEPRGPSNVPSLTAEQQTREADQRRWLEHAASARGLVRGITVAAALVSGMYLLYVVPGANFVGTGFGDSVSLLLWGFGSGWVDKVFVDWGSS
jgi:hypothetical protein